MKYRVQLYSKWSIGVDRVPVNLNDLPTREGVDDVTDQYPYFYVDDSTYLQIIDENNDVVSETTLDNIKETVDSGIDLFNEEKDLDFLYYTEEYKHQYCISEKEFNYIPDFDDFEICVRYYGRSELISINDISYKKEVLELNWEGGEGSSVFMHIITKDGNKINVEITDDGELIPEEMEDD
jgi:hypothetical protein